MKTRLVVLTMLAAAALLAEPEYVNNNLKRPANYREWVFLSSGLGMTYGPAAAANPNPMFDNVFVEPAAYKAFLATGKWPDKTMFVLEIRSSRSEGSINKGGNFQGDAVVAMEVAVKDVTRFSAGWGYYDFSRNQESAGVLPSTASCYFCHTQNGAVENTFVQFYPTLLEVARQKGTLRESYLQTEKK